MNWQQLKIASSLLLLAIVCPSCEAVDEKPDACLILQDTFAIGRGGCFSLAFSPDGKLLASVGGAGPRVRLWDVAASKEAAELRPSACYCVTFSPDGKTLVSCGDRKLLLWDVASRKLTGTLRTDVPVYGAVFSPDGKKLTAIEKWGLSVWDVQTKKSLRDHDIKPRPFRVSAYPSVTRPLVAIQGVQSGGTAASVKLLDAETAEEVLTCGWHRFYVSCVALDRAETTIATTGCDSFVRLWDRTTGANTANFEHPPTASLCLEFSPDGRILAIGYGNRVAIPAQADGERAGFRLYEISKKNILADVKLHGGGVTACAFSPDGSLLATGGNDGRILLWSVPAAWRKAKK